MRRDDPVPPPWTEEGQRRIEELGLEMVASIKFEHLSLQISFNLMFTAVGMLVKHFSYLCSTQRVMKRKKKQRRKRKNGRKRRRKKKARGKANESG